MQKMDYNYDTESTLFSTAKRQENFSANRNFNEMKYNVLFKNSSKKFDFSTDRKSYVDLLKMTSSPISEFKKKLEGSITLSKKNSKLLINERTNTYSNLFTEDSVKTNFMRNNDLKSRLNYDSQSKIKNKYGLENIVLGNNKKKENFQVFSYKESNKSNSSSLLKTLNLFRKNDNSRPSSQNINYKLNERKNEIKHLLYKKDSNISPSLMLRSSLNKSKTIGKTDISQFENILNKKKEYSNLLNSAGSNKEKISLMKKRFEKFF